jgi:hypothetical protein
MSFLACGTRQRRREAFRMNRKSSNKGNRSRRQQIFDQSRGSTWFKSTKDFETKQKDVVPDDEGSSGRSGKVQMKAIDRSGGRLEVSHSIEAGSAWFKSTGSLETKSQSMRKFEMKTVCTLPVSNLPVDGSNEPIRRKEA